MGKPYSGSFVKPDGELADTEDEFVEAWRSLCYPVCDALGWELYGWNIDDATFRQDSGTHVNLSVEAIRLLRAGIAAQEEMDQEEIGDIIASLNIEEATPEEEKEWAHDN